MTRAPIIAISGHPGGGKTTLAKALGRHFGAPVLHYDDYETITAMPPAKVMDWIARGSDYDEIELDRLVRDMADLAGTVPAPACVLLDTLLGRAHAASGRLIDLMIWIDTPPDIALARKIREAAGRARSGPAGEAEAFVGWLDSYLDHYAGFIAGTYVVQAERVRPGADIVLDGSAAAGEVLAAAIKAVRERLA